MKKLKNILSILFLSIIATAAFGQSEAKKTAVLAADPSGLALKDAVKDFLQKQGFEVTDLTGQEHQNYFDVGFNLGKAMSENKYDFGFVFCGTGMGVNLVANKFSGVFCALCESVETARLSRVVNNANVLAMGGKIVNPEKAKEMALAFVSTNFAKDNDFLNKSYNRVVELSKEIAEINAKSSKK
ncbi:MAG: RpiB/LacA/LacB family sugar-phosphate isomerase [Opitutales bacterium]|nr:RpiB/LacA/LacB family sugar-phosphate isomerase [Opitutales bacterium]